MCNNFFEIVVLKALRFRLKQRVKNCVREVIPFFAWFMDVTCLASSPYFVEVIVEVITASKKILKTLDLIFNFFLSIDKKIKNKNSRWFL